MRQFRTNILETGAVTIRIQSVQWTESVLNSWYIWVWEPSSRHRIGSSHFTPSVVFMDSVLSVSQTLGFSKLVTRDLGKKECFS